ncbi:competence protein ComGG [Cytobacillus eiseniae]|uniref:Competence protein ComGG n=1 Tax=Cytobacillus eiseniae TaxID=762947 RepID=A0ABS4RD98_9BACI|nr:competence type IV pilus minor pilin ComGG [Cytobacillus eiseniae]MBP2240862.1 competence protein ComGG [Cytobacillus eiseniae]
MLRNEKGFTYPMTFCILLLAALFLSFQLDLYISEKRIISDTEAFLKQEYYFLSAIRLVEDLFAEESNNDHFSGDISYLDGEIQYETVKITDSLYRVMFILKMNQMNKVSANGYYDKELGKMIQWNE